MDTSRPLDPAAETPGPTPAAGPVWSIGDRVCLQRIPRYLKTADPMPMLRPPDLVGIDEVGVVVGQRPLGQLAVRFRRGTFLIAVEAVAAPSGTDPAESAGP